MPSSSLVPDDPSLLLTTAGMVQFKPVFLGSKDLGFTRATTVQKCVRTTDIDIIGTTGRHHSFFEMLGNFSFGDYFKSEACAWAYEYSVKVLGLDPERLWFSIYEDDDEAEKIWTDEVGVSPDRIVRMGAKDNFWSAGPTGPCGPCSELYYDQGPEVGCGSDDCAPGCDCDRYVEYWNLVFMQYDRQEDGTLLPLPKRNIDTGLGLERMAAILQGVHSNFETDVLRAIIEVAEKLTGVAFGAASKSDTSLRILADHARAVAFMIADGILPSNEGRGYVLRRLLRRAIRHGRLLGVEDPFVNELVGKVIELMGDAYPALVSHRDLIEQIVSTEEERFSSTLRTGMSFLETALASLPEGIRTLDGAVAFALHDTYGFPLELTAEIAAERGVAVDEETFSARMEEQRERARSHVKDESWNAFGGALSDLARDAGPTDFVGYESDEADGRVLGILVDGVRVERAEKGARCEIVLDTTPFYAEQGGQVGDTGLLTAASMRFSVADTKLVDGRVHVHSGVVEEGTIAEGDDVHAAIDVWRRERIRRNHTATHLLHWALRQTLGEHATQAGSMVSPDRLRFDFTHFEALTREQLAEIERRVNRKVFENHAVRNYETSLSTAREAGVTALFGEKYGEFVRVLEIGSFSRELCGGTHVARTSEIGFVKIVAEGSVGANLRRIEAVSSIDAYELVVAEEDQLRAAAGALKVSVKDLAEKTAAVVRRVKELESGAAAAPAGLGPETAAAMVADAIDAGYRVVVAEMKDVPASAMRAAWDAVRGAGADAAVLVGADPASGKAVFLAAGNDAAVAAGFHAGEIIGRIAPLVGGRGGGKAGMAQGGGDDPSKVAEALDAARALLSTR
jgi:alanyl-tRNA synthetase